MFLHILKLWNWRKFTEKEDGQAGIEVEFKEGLNVLVGENDSGKTAIIDALKTILGTNSNDINWITEHDFSDNSQKIRIECIFQKLSNDEEAYFYEWLTLKSQTSELRVVLESEIYEDVNGQKKIRKALKAGPEGLEMPMEDAVRQLLTVTYLKPLRDATTELSPGNRSRIAQIIKSLKEFNDDSPQKEQIVDSFSSAFDDLKQILSTPVLNKIGATIDQFFEENNKKVPEIRNKEMSFQEILRKLELNIGETGIGLGSSNLLFMAAELLLLSETAIGPKIALIEEIEAHIHPQAQLRVIKHFERDVEETNIQYIFTSHSPIMAASMSLENIIFIYNNEAYPMKKGHTKLNDDDYEFLDRFLDATKANLFFARGIIFVEGDAENLLLPAIAEVIDRPLHKYGISIVNVGNLAFKRYSSIFIRSNEQKPMNFPVSVITDLDLKPQEFFKGEPNYFRIDSDINQQIARLYEASKVDDSLEQNIYILTKNLISKSRTLYGETINENYPAVDKKQKYKEVANSISELVQNAESSFNEYVESVRNILEKRYYNNVEATNVYISSPWTLEHSIATSHLKNEFENILLEVKYQNKNNRERKKKQWISIENEAERAIEVYNFLLEKGVSKAIVAQQFAKYLLSNKENLKPVIINDNALKHLIDAIYNLTGGDDSEI